MFVYSMTVGPVATNCYLLGDEITRKGAIIDPGDRGQYIAMKAKESGYQYDKILLTHTHFDHITGLEELLNAMGKDLPIYVHPDDYPGAGAGFGETVTLEQFKNNINFYQDEDTVPLGNATITVLHTPGHTPGGVSLLVDNCLFTGDTLFCGSCGRTDLPSSNPNDMMASLRRLAKLDGNYAVYPGHDRQSSLDQERKYNLFMRYAIEDEE